MGIYGLPWTSGTKVWHFWANSDPPGGPRVPFQIWQEIQFFKTFLQTPTILVSMDFPWIPATRNKHFWAASDPPGDPRVPFQIWREIQFFCGFTKPNNMNVFGPPWTSATKIWLFRADSGPLEDRRVPFQILGEINPFNFFAHPINVIVPGGGGLKSQSPHCQWTPLVPSNQNWIFMSWLDLQRVLGSPFKLSGIWIFHLFQETLQYEHRWASLVPGNQDFRFFAELIPFQILWDIQNL